jgi:hypothetical protein
MVGRLPYEWLSNGCQTVDFEISGAGMESLGSMETGY